MVPCAQCKSPKSTMVSWGCLILEQRDSQDLASFKQDALYPATGSGRRGAVALAKSRIVKFQQQSPALGVFWTNNRPTTGVSCAAFPGFFFLAEWTTPLKMVTHHNSIDPMTLWTSGTVPQNVNQSPHRCERTWWMPRNIQNAVEMFTKTAFMKVMVKWSSKRASKFQIRESVTQRF